MPLNYVGYPEENGYAMPDSMMLRVEERVMIPVEELPGKVIPHEALWGLLSRLRIMHLLSNITDDSGRSVLVQKGSLLKRLLELGCDYGHTWSCYENYFTEVYGIESSDSAKVGALCGRKIHHGDMAQMPYGDNFFDVVISAHTLEHTDAPDRLLSEVARVTADGGWSAHVVPCTPDNRRDGVTKMHPTQLGYREWLRKFEENGFRVITHFFMWALNQEEWAIIARKGDNE